MGFSLQGKTALVTGANRGIGAAITEALLANGAAKVYAAVRNPGSMKGLMDKHGSKIVAMPFDLADPQSITEAAKTASDVHLVVNNAGVLRMAKPLESESLEALQFEIDINVKGLLRTAQAFAPVLKANGGGAFVQLNSVVSFKSFPDFATYCASKAAAYSITQALRVHLGEQGTAVFSVHPGPIATDMADGAGMGEIAEPPSLVADALVEAFKTGAFHVFPDSMAKDFGRAYEGFSKDVILAEKVEA